MGQLQDEPRLSDKQGQHHVTIRNAHNTSYELEVAVIMSSNNTWIVCPTSVEGTSGYDTIAIK